MVMCMISIFRTCFAFSLSRPSLALRIPFSLSLQHLQLSPVSSDAYWAYSIDELARFDTPAMVDHVLKVTG